MPHLILTHGKIEYAWFGENKNNPALIFLHDGIGSLSLWRDFPARVAEATGCRAFVYSRFGYGQSDPIDLPRPVHFMHDEALTVLPEIFEAAQITDSILIGHSDGGSISLIYAASEFGKNIRALVLEAPHVFVEEITVQSIYKAGEEYRNGNLKQRLERHHHKNVDIAFWGWNKVWLDPDFRSWNIEKYLPGVKCPILVVQGKQDQFGTMRQVEAILAQCSGKVETLILADCKHTPHKEQQNATFDAMVNFIRKIIR
jgi:pimeloyl-ACP methyl ester carboxylesterase